MLSLIPFMVVQLLRCSSRRLGQMQCSQTACSVDVMRCYFWTLGILFQNIQKNHAKRHFLRHKMVSKKSSCTKRLGS